jgi:hypothetical protein
LVHCRRTTTRRWWLQGSRPQWATTRECCWTVG